MTYVFCLTFMPGIMSIFYGDEVGLDGIGNLDNRKPFPWGKEDDELLDFFREMGRVRKELKFMEEAELKIKNINFNWMAFERILGEEKAYIALNRTGMEQSFIVPKEYENPDKVYTLKKSLPGKLTPYGAVAMYKKN